LSYVTDPPIGTPRTNPKAEPLRLCIYTTIALLAFVLSPPVVLVWMAGLGVWGYVAVWRSGVRSSRCWLRDVRLVLVYLGLSLALGLVLTAREIASAIG
jgi:hypothetical protein